MNINFIDNEDTVCLVSLEDLNHHKKLLVQLIVEYFFLLQVIDKNISNGKEQQLKKNFHIFINNNVTDDDYFVMEEDDKKIEIFDKIYYFDDENINKIKKLKYNNNKVFSTELLVLLCEHIFKNIIKDTNEKKNLRNFANNYFKNLVEYYKNFSKKKIS